MIPFWPVKPSVSAPESKPAVIETVAPDSVLSSLSLIVSVLVIATAGLCAW